MKVRLLLPQPQFQTQLQKVLRLITETIRIRQSGQSMFIRFVNGEIDKDSDVAGGLFCAITQLRESGGVPRYELELLQELEDWFDQHLESPIDHLKTTVRYECAVCWFKPTAREYLTRAWQIVEILERNNILIWTIKSARAGHIYYEDHVQVFAIPFANRRR